jgi:hypothetical protein
MSQDSWCREVELCIIFECNRCASSASLVLGFGCHWSCYGLCVVLVCLEMGSADSGVVSWGCLPLFVAELAVAGRGDAIGGGPSAEWVVSVAA